MSSNPCQEILASLTKAFREVQVARDLTAKVSPALGKNFDSCLEFLAVLIADIREKMTAAAPPTHSKTE